MTEKELRTRFEDLTLDPATFSHAEHVRVAWTYLMEMPLADVLRIFPENLRRFAAAAGAPGKYDAAMTVGWLTVIAERIDQCKECLSWGRYIESNPELLERGVVEASWVSRTTSK